MTHAALMDRLQSIFRDQFDDDTLVIADATNAEDIEEWDSLAHMELIDTVERTFGIHFTLGEINSFQNVGDLCECILKKLP